MPNMEEMPENPGSDSRRSRMISAEVCEADALVECGKLSGHLSDASDKLVVAVNQTKAIIAEVRRLARPNRKTGVIGKRQAKKLSQALAKLDLQVNGAYMLEVYSALTGKEPRQI